MRAAAPLLAAIVTAAGCHDPSRVSARFQPNDEILLTIRVADDAASDTTPAVTALELRVDGQPTQEILVFPGSGRTEYEVLAGPLSGDDHRFEVKPSANWAPHPQLRVTGVAVEPVTAGDPRFDLFRLAPALVVRADTVGTSSDLPALMYVEDRPVAGEEAAGRALRYTTIFTNEDGGTDTPALFARWGRACDIEEVYQVRFDAAARRIDETYQGPDHEIRPFKGARIGDHPILRVATRNNMVLDTGAGTVTVRPAPIQVAPDAAPRESILDDRPWLQRLTARELAAERKPFDPRDFVYLDAKLRLTEAAAAAWVEQPDGRRIWSDRGDAKLRVTRDGWVRVAVPLPRGTAVAAAGWSCLPRPARDSTRAGDAAATAPRPHGPCQIEPKAIFTLSDDFAVRLLGVQMTPP